MRNRYLKRSLFHPVIGRPIDFFEEDKLKTVPKGFPKDFPDAELLKLKHYLVDYKFDETQTKSENFVAIVAEVLKHGYPLNRFLNYTVDEIK